MMKAAYKIDVYHLPKVKITPIPLTIKMTAPKLDGKPINCKNIKKAGNKKLNFSLLIWQEILKKVCLKLAYINKKCILKVNYLYIFYQVRKKIYTCIIFKCYRLEKLFF